jgi:hypothetical protein
MNAPQKKKPNACRQRALDDVRTDQGANEVDHNPILFRAIANALLAALNGARSIVNQLAVITSTPPFVIVEAANLIEHACDLVVSYLATGGPQ